MINPTINKNVAELVNVRIKNDIKKYNANHLLSIFKKQYIAKNAMGRNKDNGLNALVENKIGRNPEINAENNAAVSLLLIFLLNANTINGNNERSKLGTIFASNPKGSNKFKKATT
jgi:hypothetical protein